MAVTENLTVEEKLAILADAAKYDVACTSSGVDRKGIKGKTGNSVAAGICHTFTPDGRCISLLKILFTNECIFDCAYCVNRSSNDTVRTAFTPQEVAELTMGFYRRNYIEGLFLSSGVIKSPDYTMELIVRTLMLLREEYGFNGYIHCKAIPGASREYVELAGWYADRMSVNLELPTAEALKELAPHKNRKSILTPMRQIQSGIDESRHLLGMKGGNYSAYHFTRQALKRGDGFMGVGTDTAALQLNAGENVITDEQVTARRSIEKAPSVSGRIIMDEENTMSGRDRGYGCDVTNNKSMTAGSRTGGAVIHKTGSEIEKRTNLSLLGDNRITRRGFATGGQSSQMIIGASGESDYQIMAVSEALYSKFDLKRVFYSAFIRVNDDSRLPVLSGGVPLLREHRLYQADWLLRYYGFVASELLSEDRPNFNVFLDPKCDWAIRHLDIFPVEVSRADYYTLLRVPGIGVRSASRIVRIRKTTKLDYNILKKAGVVLKRAVYFITCNGQQYCPVKLDEDFITRALLSNKDKDMGRMVLSDGVTYSQLSLFDDKSFADANTHGVMLTGIEE